MRTLVTGGAGFIGGHLVRELARDPGQTICVYDAFTHSANPLLLETLPKESRGRVHLVSGNLLSASLLRETIRELDPTHCYHLAAQSHVDVSIHHPAQTFAANVEGTLELVEALRGAPNLQKMLHVSTDEVYGSLRGEDPPFTELSAYQPNSPYAASKAACDHAARAWFMTYQLPIITTHCPNNYGPWQHREKLIPMVIERALKGGAITLYGTGLNVREWVHVQDHVECLVRVMQRGLPGATYNVGGGEERNNRMIVSTLCSLLDQQLPREDGRRYWDQVTYVEDRPGHDYRYAVDASKFRADIGLPPMTPLLQGLEATVAWHITKHLSR